jgi:predicted small secreted protein
MPRRLTLALALAALLAPALSACNTMEGFGQDLSNLGNAIEGEAQEHD